MLCCGVGLTAGLTVQVIQWPSLCAAVPHPNLLFQGCGLSVDPLTAKACPADTSYHLHYFVFSHMLTLTKAQPSLVSPSLILGEKHPVF